MTLKPLSRDSIPMAIERATRYRLLNEPWHAESICHDILATDENHQEAIHILILALTDQFNTKFKKGMKEAESYVEKLEDEYLRLYTQGLIYERQGTAALNRSTPRSKFIAYELIMAAMNQYERADAIKPKSNEEAVLRWNACCRMIDHHQLHASDEEDVQHLLDAF